MSNAVVSPSHLTSWFRDCGYLHGTTLMENKSNVSRSTVLLTLTVQKLLYVPSSLALTSSTFCLQCVFLRSFLGEFAKLRKATVSFVMSLCLSVCLSVCPFALSSSPPTGQILMKFDVLVFFENYRGKSNFTKI